tara:strand:- start:21 stop:953 length:933 start_codon:yes stop_codon:yes gene_type:complete
MSSTFTYSPVPSWPKLPGDISLKEATSVARDSADNIYIFNRGEIPMLIFSNEGNLINKWGKGDFVRPHGIYIDDTDTLFLVDDGGHFLKKCTKEGKLLKTIGTPSTPAEWQSGGIFNRPTDVTVDSEGFLYVSDGYGNSRIHKFDKEGNHVISWGEPGTEKGQFNLPHNLCLVNDQFLWVCDRENFRVQVFDKEGKWLDQFHFHRPQSIYLGKGKLEGFIVLSEAGTGMHTQVGVPDIGNVIRVLDYQGNTVAKLGDSQPGEGPNQFISPHGITATSSGDIIVAEVSFTAYGSKLKPPKEVVSIRRWNID